MEPNSEDRAHRRPSAERHRAPLDALDEAIVWELVRDATLPNKELAARLGVAQSTTINRVRALRDAGVLRGAHQQVDLLALGFPIQALVFVRLRPQARPHIKAFALSAARLPQTVSVFFLGGNDDFVIHVVATSTDQLRDLVAIRLSMDPAVATTSTHVVFDHYLGEDQMDHIKGWDEIRAPIEG